MFKKGQKSSFRNLILRLNILLIGLFNFETLRLNISNRPNFVFYFFYIKILLVTMKVGTEGFNLSATNVIYSYV